MKMNKLRQLVSLVGTVILAGTLLTGCSKGPSESITFFNYGENIDNETIPLMTWIRCMLSYLVVM